ncbi:MAG: hypothetical protein NVS9B13_15460 [Candidatus Acidiferrum sp.]
MSGKWKQTIHLANMLVLACLVMAGLPQKAAADQYDPPGRVARLKYVRGAVSFQPAGETDWVSAVTNRPMTTGDKLWADNGARAEVRLGSATIRLDGGTGFSFLNLDDRTVQLQLTQGTVDIRVQRLGNDEVFEVDTPNQAFSVLRPGQYRVQASEDGNSTFVTVRSGEGEATGGGQRYSIHSGERGTFTGTDYLTANVVRAGGNDEFDNWGESRSRYDQGSRSRRYVSPEVVGYEDLDDNGSWRDERGYGNVWVPRVRSGWAPYHDGHWAWISPWGWTWVDDAPWGYAPFHYGRWISNRGEWGWIPGPIAVEPVYAPALVAFIGGSNFGLSISVGGGGYGGSDVGWFPLGPSEVYVPGYNTSRDYVNRVNVSNTTVNTTTITNVYNNQVTNNNIINNNTTNNNQVTNNNTNNGNTNINYVNRTVPGAVTAVPVAAFVSAQPVAKSAVAVNAQQIAAARVSSRADVTPVRNSVLGSSASSANHVAQPPASVANRTVVAKATPPPPPIPFVKQQQSLAAHPGQPLAAREVQTLRAANAALPPPAVKQAPPGKAATPNRNPATAQPLAAKPAAPANAPSSRPATMPSSNGGANASANPSAPMRSDRPPSATQNRAAPPANVPAAANPGARNNTPPANLPANMPAPNRNASTTSTPNQPMRADRPPSAQQNRAQSPPSPAAEVKLKDPRIDAYRGRPVPQQAPVRQSVPHQPTQNRPAAPRQDRSPMAPVQMRPTPQIVAPVERNTRPAPVVREPAPSPNRPAPQPIARPVQAQPRQADRPPTSAFKVNKSPIDTRAASQRGQTSRSQAAQTAPKPLPKASNQPQSKTVHPPAEPQQ